MMILNQVLCKMSNMKRIGILTFHDLDNYGTLLQSFALERYLESLGFEAEVIRHSEVNYEKGIQKGVREKAKRLFSDLANIGNLRFRHNAFSYSKSPHEYFDDFRNQFIKYSDKYNRGELNSLHGYYALLLGSDQIFNPSCMNDAFSLNFETTIPSFSYAASFGVGNVEPKYYDFYAHLGKMVAISCRESANSRFLEALVNKNVSVCLDPVFLVEKECFSSLLQPISHRGFVFQYFLGDEERNVKYVRRYSKQKMKAVYSIPTNRNLSFFHRSINYLHDFSIQNFLSHLQESSVVFTDSYHVMLLSIIFDKEFFVLPKHKSGQSMSENIRITELLNELALSSRLINRYAEIDDCEPINYSKVKMILKSRIYQSREFIINTLHDISNLEKVSIADKAQSGEK